MPSSPVPQHPNTPEQGEGNCPTCGLPKDLARILRDQSTIVPQDQAVWELLARWRDAPSNTASGNA